VFGASQVFYELFVQILKGGRMMSTLKQLREMLGKTQKEMAEILNVSLRGYQMYEEGKSNLPPAKMVLLAQKFGVNLHWLLTGEGEPFVRPPIEVKKKTTVG
jgi:transcriptional regulator with XRE-family HTH domain